ncbi:MAG: ABC transporter permease/substrate-binding protein [Christensenellales bacterium]|jgi:osmoprotectant transport system permease protein
MISFFQYVFDNRAALLQYTFEHLRIGLLAVLLAIIVGVPIGLLIARARGLSRPVLGFSNVMQAIPSLALMGFFIPFIGIGDKTAIVIIALYGLLPIIRNTYTGLTNVDAAMLEAARGIGMKTGQILRKIQIPLALPVIMAGIRIAAVTAIGTTTIAAFIGGGGLGKQVYAGIQIVSTNMILSGAIPAALLALLMDLLFSVIEKALVPVSLRIASVAVNTAAIKKIKRRRRTILVVGLLIVAVLFGSVVYDAVSRSARKSIIVGSKEYIEVRIINEVYAQLIEAHTDILVERKPALGSTMVVWEALNAGEVDIVPDYTGTYYATVLGLPTSVGMQVDSTYRAVADELEKHNLHAAAQLGPNNVYVFACGPELAEKYNLKTVSDLAKIAKNLRIGCSPDFHSRDADGLPGVSRMYDMEFKEISTFGAAPMYIAHENDEIDVMVTYATDGLLQKYDLVFLEDDKNFFPPYVIFGMYNDKIRDEYPEVVELLNSLELAITDAEMREMNYRGAELQEEPRDIARDFLVSKGFISE